MRNTNTQRIIIFAILTTLLCQDCICAEGRRGFNHFLHLAPRSPFEAGGAEDEAGVVARSPFEARGPAKGFYQEVAEYCFGLYPHDNPANIYLRDVASPIIKRMSLEKEVRVCLVRSPDINAFVFPDGAVYVSDGLLRFVKYREELEFVLSHELRHYKRRHLEEKVIFNSGEIMKGIGRKRLMEIEADIFSLTKAEETDINPYGGIVFFRRLMEETKEPGDASLSHGSLINRVIQLVYPSRLFDIETLSATLTEIPGDVKGSLLFETALDDRFEKIFTPDDDEMGPDKAIRLNHERRNLIEDLKESIVIFAGISSIRQRCDRFFEEKDQSKFKEWRYKEEMEIYRILLEKLKPYIEGIISREKGDEKRKIFIESILWGLGTGLNLKEETEVRIGERLSEAIETRDDLELIINLLKENIFLERGLSIGYLPDEFAEFIVITVLDADIFSRDSEFDVEGYTDFCARFLTALEDFYKRHGIKIDTGSLYNRLLIQVFYSLEYEDLKDVSPLLLKRAKGSREILQELLRRIPLREFIYDIVPLISPDLESVGILQVLFLKKQEGNEEAEALLQELSSVDISMKGKSREEIMKIALFIFYIGIGLDCFPEGIFTEEHIEDLFILFMFTKDEGLVSARWSDKFGIMEFSRLKDLLELLYKPDKHRALEEEFGFNIRFDPARDKSSNFPYTLFSIIRNYFVKRFGESDYALPEFSAELREISTIINNKVSLITAYSSDVLDTSQEFIHKALVRYDLIKIDSPEKAEAVMYLSFYMPNRTTACILQERALRHLAEVWDFDRMIKFLEGTEKGLIVASKAVEEIIENKARTPDQIRYIRKKIGHFMEFRIRESEDFLEGLGNVAVFEQIIDRCFRNKDSYRELLLALTDPSNNQEHLKKLCLRIYLKVFLLSQEDLARDVNLDEADEDALKKAVGEWVSDLGSYVHGQQDESGHSLSTVLRIGPQGIFGYFHNLDPIARYFILHELLVGKHGVLLQRGGTDWLIKQLFARFIDKAKDNSERKRLRISKEVLTEFARRTTGQSQHDILYFMVAPILFDRFLKSDSPELDRRNYAKAFSKIVTKRLRNLYEPGKNRKLLEMLIDASMDREHYRTEEDLLRGGFIAVDVSSKMDSINLIIEIAQRLGVVGVRFLQLLGQYLDLPKEIEQEFLKVYDRVIGQSKISAFSILEKECPEIVNNIADMSPAIEGGSLRTTFILTMKDGRRLIAKILNPNAGFHAETCVGVLEQVIDCLCEKDEKTYGTAKMLLPDLRQWIKEDIESSQFGERDGQFRAANLSLQGETWQRNSDYKTDIPELISHGPRHQIEEYIEGHNLTQWKELQEQEHDLEQVVSLITNHFFSQIAGGNLVHSDIHWGNFRVTKDKKIYILDRNYYLKLSEQDGLFLAQLRPGQDFEPLLDSIIGYLLNCPENADWKGDRDLLREGLLDNFGTISRDKLRSIGNLTNIILYLRKQGLKIPLRMALMIKNLQSLNRMAVKAGFKDLNEAYSPQGRGLGGEGEGEGEGEPLRSV